MNQITIARPGQGASPFDNSYARLPERFFARQPPAPVKAPRLIRLNAGLAEVLGLDAAALNSPEGIAMLAGNALPEGAEPIAMAYAGHQFGGWVPQLGDGRALLLGEIVGKDGSRRDMQLKGSGRTPFSRGGDGRAPLGPVLREYILSEAMAALGVPTTRALAAVATGETVMRETPLPGAVLTRVAASHIRVGTFQYFSAREDNEALRTLVEHCIERHDPDTARADNPVLAFLTGVVARQAKLVATWMSLGFIHGVMNTDNMTVSGETIDYGPCAFMEGYNPATVYSYIDQMGRYAYGNQPGIAHWNLACLAQTLIPLLHDQPEEAVKLAQPVIDGFVSAYKTAWLDAFRRKLGLTTAEEGDDALAEDLLTLMARNDADFTRTFRDLDRDPPEWMAEWHSRWTARLDAEGQTPDTIREALHAANPLYIPRNHLVEAAIAAAMKGDFEIFETLVEVTQNPFVEQPGMAAYAIPARPEEAVRNTFCGT